MLGLTFVSLVHVVVLLLHQTGVTYLQSVDLQVMQGLVDWTTAQTICRDYKHILLPELGNPLLKILDGLDPEEIVWLNAKNVVIQYGGTLSVSLKFSYVPDDNKFAPYLCYNASSGETSRNVHPQPLSWQQTKTMCANTPETGLLNVSTPEQVKNYVFLFEQGVTFWIDKMPSLKLPDLVSGSLQMREECWGVMKQPNGSLIYISEDCSNKHKVICTLDEKCAPTVTRMFTVWSKHNRNAAKKTTDGFQGVGSATGGYIAVILTSTVVILAVITAAYYVRGRWWRGKNLSVYMQSVTKRQISLKMLSQPMPSGSQPTGMQATLQLTLWPKEQTDT